MHLIKSRAFDVQPVRSGHLTRYHVTIRCSCCQRTLHYSGNKHPRAEFLTGWFSRQGWLLGKLPADDKCKACLKGKTANPLDRVFDAKPIQAPAARPAAPPPTANMERQVAAMSATIERLTEQQQALQDQVTRQAEEIARLTALVSAAPPALPTPQPPPLVVQPPAPGPELIPLSQLPPPKRSQPLHPGYLDHIRALDAEGVHYKEAARRLGLGASTVYRYLREASQGSHVHH